MAPKFRVGAHVCWHSEAGRVSGRTVNAHSKDSTFKGYARHASKDDPQYGIKSDKTDHVASTRAARFDVSASGSTFFTIGHSNRSVDDFVTLLKARSVTLVADVRKIPRSRSNPQFNLDALPETLSQHGIDFAHINELGGRRGPQRQIPSAANAFWHNQSFHNYADYAASSSFRSGLNRLRVVAHGRACAIMCAESLWWRCHRRIIADYLLASGERVFHIIGPGQVQEAVMTDVARADSHGILSYPASQAALWSQTSDET